MKTFAAGVKVNKDNAQSFLLEEYLENFKKKEL